MPHLNQGRIDKLAPDRISTDLLIEELKSRIKLAEYEQKTTFEKCEQEKIENFSTLIQQRRKNRIHRTSMFSSTQQSGVNIPDCHNINYAFENKQVDEKLFIKRKKMQEAVALQDVKVCEAIKKYNIKAHEREQKEKQAFVLQNEIDMLKSYKERKLMSDLHSTEGQKTRILENNIEKLKMKISSAELITGHYDTIIDRLKQETHNYPWKLDELEAEVHVHRKALADAALTNREALGLMEKSIQNTKDFHDEYFESKKNRDRMLTNTRKDVSKANMEVRGTDKPKVIKPGTNIINPLQEIINKEAEEAQNIQNKYEQQRKRRLEFEETASFLKNACKVSGKEEILPAITQQHEVQRALRLQIESLEDQKKILEMEKDGIDKEYKTLKYHGEKKVSEGLKLIEEETAKVDDVKRKLSHVVNDIKKKEDLLNDVDIALNNFFLLLTKHKIEPHARQMMTGEIEVDLATLTEALHEMSDQISVHGKLVDFLENPEFLDYMEDVLPRANTRVDTQGEEEEGPDVFEDEPSSKVISEVMTREDIKRASQKLIEKNQGKQRRRNKNK